MNVNDAIFTIGGLVFTFFLIPALRDRQKPPVWTSAPTALILYVFAANYAMLDLFFSAAVTFITAACWTLLAFQRAENDALTH